VVAVSSCPLCNYEKYILKKTYKTNEIVSMYKNILGIDVSYLFKSDETRMCQCINCRLVYFTPALEGDSLFYKKLSDFWWYYMDEKYEYDYILSKLCEVKPNKILEVGCGTGLFVDKIKDSFDVKVIETSKKALEILNSKGIMLDEDGEKYDFIVSFQVLEHISDVKSFLDKLINEKLENGGFIFLTMPNPDSEYMKEILQATDFPPHHLTRWNKQSLFSLAHLYRLDIIEYFHEPILNLHYYDLIIERIKKFSNHVSNLNLTINENIVLSQSMLFSDINELKGHTHGILLKKGLDYKKYRIE
jgi:SAM-dependent methyltransferase